MGSNKFPSLRELCFIFEKFWFETTNRDKDSKFWRGEKKNPSFFVSLRNNKTLALAGILYIYAWIVVIPALGMTHLPDYPVSDQGEDHWILVTSWFLCESLILDGKIWLHLSVFFRNVAPYLTLLWIIAHSEYVSVIINFTQVNNSLNKANTWYTFTLLTEGHLESESEGDRLNAFTLSLLTDRTPGGSLIDINGVGQGG